MDFWTRLIGGVSGQRKESDSNNPQARLTRFKKVYSQVLTAWQKSKNLSTDNSALESLYTSFQRLTNILHEESRSPAPHLCLSFAASSQIYTAVANVGATAYNEAIIREGVAVFAALIDSEEEEFLSNGRFAQSLMGFVSKIISGSSAAYVGEDTRSEIVELLFGIAAKIRLQPEILPVWFSLRNKQDADVHMTAEDADAPRDFAGLTQKEDFPLCYHLIDHVHHEGRIGDFARTGLLYVFESASKSPELEQWIVESDLATLMATGLGALYSQLSRKLSIVHPEADMPIILTMSDYAEMKPSTEAESVYTPLLKSQVDTFLSYLTFWQDVLEHCSSLDVRETLIDHFRVLFLQQLLYPSLLESSDVDGGSSVAVLTYLRFILDSLDHPELVHMILHYLLALPDNPLPTSASTPKTPVALKRRMSLMLLSQTKNPSDDDLNPSLFNLVDVILNSIRSSNSQTAIAALKLVTVILNKNHHYALGTLLRVVMVHLKDPQRTTGSLRTEAENYLDIASDIGGDDGLDDAYESHLKDMTHTIETHPCTSRALAFPEIGLPSNATSIDRIPSGGPSRVDTHHLNANDPLMTSLIGLLTTFFTNNVETNLALTETIVILASCFHLRLEGWFAVEPSFYSFASSTTAPSSPSHTRAPSLSASHPSLNLASSQSNLTASEIQDDPFRALSICARSPSWSQAHTPPLLRALENLQEVTSQLRNHIPHFDVLVANRKQAFRVHDEIEEAMNAPPPLLAATSTPQRSTGASPARGTASPAASNMSRQPSDSGPGVSQTPQRNPVQRVLRDEMASPTPIGRSRSPGKRLGMPSTPSATPVGRRVGRAALSPDVASPEETRTGRPGRMGRRHVSGEVASIGRRIRFRVAGGKVELIVERDPESGSDLGHGADGAVESKDEGATSPPPPPPPPKDDVKPDPSTPPKPPPKRTVQTTERGEQRKSKPPNKSPAGIKSKTSGTGKTKEQEEKRQSSAIEDEIEEQHEEIIHDCSLSHLLTNVVVLQEFILELVALMQARATLFADREIRFA